ncbi:MAG: class I adenylate-forming enzyme family protein [Pseudomonadota bacterium]
MYDVLKQTFADMTADGQMFAIKTVEVNGQQLKSWASAPNSLRDIWLSTAGHAEADYLVYRDERWTYAEAHEEVAKIANWMVSQGVRPGDHVAIAMRNYPEWMLSYWAIACVGAVSVGVNAWWVAEELKYGLQDSNSKLLIADEERLDRFAECREDLPDIKVAAVRVDDVPEWATPWSEVLAVTPELPEADIDTDDVASIFYTSGTTGKPKGAQLTHRGCVNNILSVMFGTLAQATAQAKAEGNDAPNLLGGSKNQMAAIVATPLFHVTANNCLAQTTTIAGGKLVHMHKWDAGEALRLIEQEKITVFTGVPTMSREIIMHPDFASRDTSSLSALNGGGAAVQPDLVGKIDKGGRGARPGQGYGMTEASGIISTSAGYFLSDKPSSQGFVAPIFDVKCVDTEGKTLPTGETGEVCVKGAQVIKGYLNRPEATAETIVDGWLHTGDIGYIDEDNFIYLVDRAKDMVIRGGENVYCSEVESALYKHPSVAECSVFSVPDERLGEEVGAAVYPAAGTTPSADELRVLCKEQLAAYKAPRYIWVLDTPLPRNASGKFVKKELQKSLDIAAAG